MRVRGQDDYTNFPAHGLHHIARQAALLCEANLQVLLHAFANHIVFRSLLPAFNCFTGRSQSDILMCHAVFIINTEEGRKKKQVESKQTRRHVAYASLPVIWFLNKQWITFHVTSHSNTIKSALQTMLTFHPQRSWFKTTWELCFQSSIVSSCSNLAVGMGGVYEMLLGRADMKFITLAVREGGVWRGRGGVYDCNQTQASPIWWKHFSFCFTGAILYLNWVKAKKNARVEMRSQSGGAGRK